MKAISILAFFLGVTEASVRSRRELAFERIAGYQPSTLVTGSNALDLDIRIIKQQLAVGTPTSFNVAYAVYDKGAFCDPIAKIQLGAPLPKPLSQGDTIAGFSTGGVNEVHATLIDNTAKGETEIHVAYEINQMQSNYVGCQVGGNPNPRTERCYAPDGNLIVTGLDAPANYSYNVLTDNVNGITTRGFSITARDDMYVCESTCPYVDFDKFVNYYGEFDYADQWVQSAYDTTLTVFDNGNADFRNYYTPGKTEAIQLGIVFLHVWMQVVNMMEKALDNCAQSGEGLEEWDEAVAFYVGSLEGSGGAGEGVLLYDLADKRCGDFNTCGKNGNSILGTSYVNIEVINRFKAGQRNVQESDCVAARGDKEHIVQLMLIPLIQGTLRYAHLQGTGVDTGEKANAEGGVFAAAVLPHVYACVKEDAEIIFESMGAGHTKATDFSAVKAALERNYQCMGITCAEVGGLWDSVEEKYFPQSEPCGSGKRKKNGSSTNVNGVDNPGLAIGLAVGAAAVLFIIVILSNFCGKKAAPPVSVAPQNDAQLT